MRASTKIGILSLSLSFFTTMVLATVIHQLTRSAVSTISPEPWGSFSSEPTEIPEYSRGPAELPRYYRMRNMDVEVRFLDDEHWKRLEEYVYPGQTASVGGDLKVAGFTPTLPAPGRTCRVYLPARVFGLLIKPSWGNAQWLDSNANVILSHEIAHCLAGTFHPTDVDSEDEYRPLRPRVVATPGK